VEGVRIDKWLWAARFYKTRSLANDAVSGGRVHVNDARVKPSKEIRCGDTVVVTVGPVRRTVEVTGLSDRRGSAVVAATLYTETAESTTAREQAALERRQARPIGADLGARPTKLDRRRLEALRRAQRGR
jgi:ribosome-associated heat shock protein Hsp15